jgi:hypothetical protein
MFLTEVAITQNEKKPNADMNSLNQRIPYCCAGQSLDEENIEKLLSRTLRLTTPF